MAAHPPASTLLPLVALLAALLCGGGCQSPEAASTRPPAAFEGLLGAVVRIDVRETTYEQGRARDTRSTGSGVILTAGGHILTNAHVVSPQASEVSVTLSSLERVDARLVGWDHWTDLALLQLDLEEMEERGLTFSRAQFGDSEALVPGQVVYAVGTPNGLTRTVTRGIISNTNRYFEGRELPGGYETGAFNTWLQTDAAINPGNSGGPLVTGEGRVVGINSRAYLGANDLGFAVPATTARAVMAALLDRGEVVRSYSGLVFGPLQDLEDFFDLALNTGVLVNSVDPGSPADGAGLRAGDIVLAIDGRPVDGRFPEQLPPINARIAAVPVGGELALTVKRGGATFTRTLATERLESRVGERWAFEEWGISVEEVSRAYARERRLKTHDGVLVTGTQPAFPAAEAGLQPGDILTGINREPLATLDDLREAYRAYEESPERVLLEVLRNHQTSLLVLKP